MAKRVIESVPLSRFGVLVAQLESIAASARQQPPDALLCFDLLSELVAAIEEEPKESIQQWQRKCEEALYSLLILGARWPVQHLASSAMGRVIARGNGISIYSRASRLQGWLVDSKRSEPHSCSASGVRAKDLQIGLALSWVSFLQVIRLKYRFPDSKLQNFSLQAMDMLQGNSSVDAHALAYMVLEPEHKSGTFS